MVDPVESSLVEQLTRARAVEKRVRRRVRRGQSASSAVVVIASILLLWPNAQAEDFAGNGGVALRAIFWFLYALLVAAAAIVCGVAVHVACKGRVLAARQQTARAGSALYAFRSAHGYVSAGEDVSWTPRTDEGRQVRSVRPGGVP